jgi:hypothetical protein
MDYTYWLGCIQSSLPLERFRVDRATPRSMSKIFV